MDTEAQIDAHNRKELWTDVANHLQVARESLEQAQSALDDLHVEHISENLKPTVEAVERFRKLAVDKRDEGADHALGR